MSLLSKLPEWLLWILAAPLVAVVAIWVASLGGCATMDAPEEFAWHRQRTASVIPYSVVYVAPGLLATACGVEKVRACTVHSQRIIFLPEGAPAWMLEHERRHEGGENHS